MLIKGHAWTAGDKVRNTRKTIGETHEGFEITLPPGAVGTIDGFHAFGGLQGNAMDVAFAVPVEMLPPEAEDQEQFIINVFDDGDDEGSFEPVEEALA